MIIYGKVTQLKMYRTAKENEVSKRGRLEERK